MDSIKVVTVQNSPIEYVNGKYYLLTDISKTRYRSDRGTDIYVKNDNCQIYRYRGQWRIANFGKTVYHEIYACIYDNLSIDRIDISQNTRDTQNSVNKRLAIVISCNDRYVGKSIVALKNFNYHHPESDMFIIGTRFSQKSRSLATEHNVKLIEVDLSSDLIKFDKRPYNATYPIECFYHFYAHICLSDYDYIVTTEADIYFNRPIDPDMFEAVDYVGVSYHNSHLNKEYFWIMRDMDKFSKALGHTEVTGYRPLGGVRIYNVKGLNEINLYNQIIDVYQKCWSVGRPICGDDSTLQLYQIYHPDHVKTISTDLMIIFYDFGLEHVDEVYSFHFGGPNKKYWDLEPAKEGVESYFREKMIEFVRKNFSSGFIREYLPTLQESSVFGDIPVLFVNMDKHTDRKEHITKLLDTGAQKYHRIPGVNGYALVKQVKNNNIRFEMEGIEYDITHAETKNAHVIGCLMSHLNGFKYAMDNDLDIFVMIEDDLNVSYKDYWDMMVTEIVDAAPDEWGIIKLHSNHTKRNQADYELYQKGQKFRKLSTQMSSLVHEWSTACYIVNRKYLKAFYAKYVKDGVFRINNPQYLPADITMYSAGNAYIYTCPIFDVTDVSGNRADISSNDFIKSIYSKE